MDTVLPLIAMIAGLTVGTLALVSARKQPDKARQLRGIGTLFFGIAGVMAVLLVL